MIDPIVAARPDPAGVGTEVEPAVAGASVQYMNPEAIAADTSLPREQKQRFLSEWAAAIADPGAAAETGAPAGAHRADDLALRICAALAAVDKAGADETDAGADAPEPYSKRQADAADRRR